MNTTEYTPQAMTTASPTAGGHGVSEDLVHAVLGIGDEAGELLAAKTSKNIIEECGDLLWFAALADDTLALNLFQRHEKSPVEGSTPYDIATNALTLAGLLKKPYAYGKTLPEHAIKFRLLSIISAVEVIAERLNITLAEVMELNLLKLKMRFPDKFACAAAINRNVPHEQALFEHWQTVLPLIRESAVWFLCDQSSLGDAKAYLSEHHDPGTCHSVFLKPDQSDQDGYWLVYARKSPNSNATGE